MEELENMDLSLEQTTRGAKQAVGAIREVAKAMEQFTLKAAQAFHSQGAADKMARTVDALRQNLSLLKAAWTQAAAPIGCVLIPALSKAVGAVTDFVQNAGLVLGTVMQAVYGNRALGQSALTAAQGQQTLTKRVTATGKALRRTLAGFDQINRLNTSGSGSSTTTTTTVPQIDEAQVLSPELYAISQKILDLLQPLLHIDIAPLQEAFAGLWAVVQPILQSFGQLLEWVYLQLFVPFATWVVETMAPALAQVLTAGLMAASAALELLTPMVQLLWESLQPVADFIGQVVILVLQSMTQVFLNLAREIQNWAPRIQNLFGTIAQAIQLAWQSAGPVLQGFLDHCRTIFSGVSQTVATAADFLMTALGRITAFLAGGFTESWKSAWAGITGFLKSTVNSVIGLINRMLQAIGSGINAVIRTANGVKFTVPSWVPGIGGRTYGFSMRQIQVPQVPYLAQGAVLPANRPFLAMVGDQRHGTNVEAPLATIQEAVALVMEDLISSNLAGQEAVVAKLSQILEAVLGIHLGDKAVYEAVDRHKQNMAVIHGGFV